MIELGQSARLRTTQAILICLMIGLTSCDPNITRANGALGISVSADGKNIQIQFVLCSDELVNVVELLDHQGGNAIGEDVDPILWKITSSAGSPLESFTVGKIPAGFTEAVPLTREVGDDTSLGVIVESTQGEAVNVFRLSDLRSDRVFSRLKSLSPSEFQEQASGTCH